jgi:very-short-patch-repair endonuclease
MSIELARKLRRLSTPPERAMWAILYSLRQQGHHFRRQAALGPYYADFANLDESIVIEVDGDSHSNDKAVAADARRDAYLRSRGFRVLRFSNHDVLHNRDGVYETIAAVLAQAAAPTPSPPQGGGRRKDRPEGAKRLARRERKPRRGGDPERMGASPSPSRGGDRGGGGPEP